MYIAHRCPKVDEHRARVSQTINDETTIFVGNHYEETNGVVTKHYFAGAQRIAMSRDVDNYPNWFCIHEERKKTFKRRSFFYAQAKLKIKQGSKHTGALQSQHLVE